MIPILIIVLAVRFAVSENSEEYCTFNPTCGSDAKLYSSICDLQERNIANDVTEVDWKDCQVDCDRTYCTREYYPYCGTDGNIYGNECSLLSASCGKTEKILREPLINCLEKKCPDNCEESDADCKDEVKSCRSPWKLWIM